MDLEIWLKIHTNVSNFETFVWIQNNSVILFKMGKHSDFHLSFFQIVDAWRAFTVVTKLMKNLKSLYGFGGRCLKIRDVCMEFEPCFKVYNLVSVHPKSIILGQMINLDMIFHLVVSVYRLVKIWNSPSSLLNFGTAYYLTWDDLYTWYMKAKRSFISLAAFRVDSISLRRGYMLINLYKAKTYTPFSWLVF